MWLLQHMPMLLSARGVKKQGQGWTQNSGPWISLGPKISARKPQTCVSSVLKMTDMKGSTSTDADIQAKCKEWDETTCPICMDFPHNAVLIICSSHEKGCRSYICDTSYRHSNCLDRFKKLRENSRNNPSQPSSLFRDDSVSEELGQRAPRSPTSEPFLWGPRTTRNYLETHEDDNMDENDDMISAGLFEALEENSSSQESDQYSEAQANERISPDESGGEKTSDLNCLKCPLCRGAIVGWMIIKEARDYLDLKPKSCARESCSFSGNYRELRRHARRAHPLVRPADVDPSRQRAWHHLERQQEHGDILSAIRSAMPGAVVLGDYVLDNGYGPSRDRETSDGSGPWWTSFFLFHLIRNPRASPDESRGSSRTWTTHRRSSLRNQLFPDILLSLHDDEDDGDDNNDDDLEPEDDIPVPRRRRRFTRSVLDEQHPSLGHQNLWGENLLGLQDDDGQEPDDDIPVPRRRRRLTRSRLDDEQP